jgi:serine/threonine protein kinase
MRASPGQWVTESIELLSPIAEGAMGKVFVAFHHGLRTRVAVKFVSDELAESTPEALARFQLEASASSQIKSPHVVQTFDSGVSQFGAPYIVMELLEGESLGDRLRRAGPLSLAEAALVLQQTARALNRAHALGIVHRDIKPDNIFLTHSDEGILCKILDFGIAKQTRLPAMGGLTTDGKLVGTPEYMSPEQVLEDRPVDARADLWALAVVMYVSLTGQLPFQGRTLGQLCLNLVNRPPPPPSQLRLDLPSFIDGWFARALHREPVRRFDSAREMALAFRGDGDTPLIDVGSITSLGDGTDKSFGAVVGLPAGERRLPSHLRTPLAATAVLASVGLLAAAVVVLAGGEPASRAQSAIGSWLADAALDERAAELAAEPRELVDLDGQEEERSLEHRTARSVPPRTTGPPKPKTATPAPADNPPPSDRRGEAELGF